MTSVLTDTTDTQRAVADEILDRESQRRDHVVVALSGAHAYGFPSPDSDLDLKAIHLIPTRELLGLEAPLEHADILETHRGVEIDYTSNELGAVIRGILAGNGNYIERVLGALIMRTSPIHDGLQPICQGALSRRVHRHYRGFAHNQYQAVLQHERPPAKRVLYVLRTALTGTHLLRSGQLVVDVNSLLDEYGHQAAHELIEAKKAGEQTLLDASAKRRWQGALQRALAELDAALDGSCLPEEAANGDDANAWLVATRLARV
jgi:hypothetical protein